MTLNKKMTFLVTTGVILIGVGIFVAYRRYSSPHPQNQHLSSDESTDTPQSNKTANIEDGVNTPESDMVYAEYPVDPTYALQDLIHNYEQELMEEADRKAGKAIMIAEWTAARRAGRTRWGSDKWMKSPEYYASLDTTMLTDECFGDGIFGVEMALYNDPLSGLESLRIFHNGFAELLKRDDMWKGILHLYDTLSLQINPHADLAQIVRASSQLDELRKLYRLAPLKDQVKGRESAFLAAHIRVLEKYKQYLDKYDRNRPGTGGMPGFFREPCSVAQVALLLAKQIDPRWYAEIEPQIRKVRWTEEQKVADLQEFIELVLDSLDHIKMKGGNMER